MYVTLDIEAVTVDFYNSIGFVSLHSAMHPMFATEQQD